MDTLFTLPDNGLRYEVLEGELVVSPAAQPRHNLAADRLRTLVAAALPPEVEVIRNSAVRLPNGDGTTPDLLVTTADPDEVPRGVPAALVHTVVEVVSPPSVTTGRVTKNWLYPAAGIPCYWRVELQPWWEHLCPVPAIVVRMLGEDGNWRTTLYPAGQPASLPLMVGRRELLTVELDPACLVGRRTADQRTDLGHLAVR
ncbi:Uma2 family endonuclease [Planosporangium sp. 12N6]|uniref:Uma2 family endonuclease n=1 Tax=Planosporangium spinosum TaxID=3402278 RepID=UPI003CE98237